MANNNLYYQVRRLRNTRYKIALELKNSLNQSNQYRDNILYLKKIIFLQASCIAAIFLTRIFT